MLYFKSGATLQDDESCARTVLDYCGGQSDNDDDDDEDVGMVKMTFVLMT